METRVDAYRNLNDDCISLRSREPETRGRVIDHVDTALIRDAEFVVQPKGRQRVIDEECKNVHAFVRGRVVASLPEGSTGSGVAVTYNPYEYDSFVTREGERPVLEAEHTRVTTDGVTAFGTTYKSER